MKQRKIFKLWKQPSLQIPVQFSFLRTYCYIVLSTLIQFLWFEQVVLKLLSVEYFQKQVLLTLPPQPSTCPPKAFSVLISLTVDKPKLIVFI